MAGRRRGARTGRGWDAAPPRARRTTPRKPAPAETAPGELRAGAPVLPELPAEKAREICLQLLAERPRTRKELADALARRGIPAEVSAEVLDRYDEVGIVDDAAFARAWVTSRHHGRGLARRALAAELRRKGVESDALGQAMDELDDATEARTARALVDRRLRTERGAPEATFRRLVAMLARKGYPPGLAFGVVKEALAEREEGSAFVEQLDVEALETAALETAALETEERDREER
jgi:regulatory protein